MAARTARWTGPLPAFALPLLTSDERPARGPHVEVDVVAEFGLIQELLGIDVLFQAGFLEKIDAVPGQHVGIKESREIFGAGADGPYDQLLLVAVPAGRGAHGSTEAAILDGVINDDARRIGARHGVPVSVIGRRGLFEKDLDVGRLFRANIKTCEGVELGGAQDIAPDVLDLEIAGEKIGNGGRTHFPITVQFVPL
jgi:hypothetical protein